LVLSAFVALCYLASVLADLSPDAVERRNATENAAVVALVTKVYATNDWHGMDPPSSSTLVKTISFDENDWVSVEMVSSKVPTDR
jgi:hypothetical protein